MTTKRGKTVSFYFPAEAIDEQSLWENLPSKGEWVVEKLREDSMQIEAKILERLNKINKEELELKSRLETVRKKRQLMRAKLTPEMAEMRHENALRRLYVEAFDGNIQGAKDLGERFINDGDITKDELDKTLAEVQKKKERLAGAGAVVPAQKPRKEAEAAGGRP